MLNSAPLADGLEKALLAHALADNAVLDAMEAVRSDDFANPVYGELWTLMLDLRREGRAINVATLPGLTGADPLGDATPLEVLRAVTFGENVPGPSELADAILDASLRRTIAAQGEWLAGQSQSLRTKPADILSVHTRELDALLARANGRRRSCLSFDEAIDEMLDDLQAPQGNRLSTGIKDLDRTLGGFGTSEFHILAGRSSMGKSAVASNIASNVAIAGHGVLIFSLEMTRKQWLQRIASEATWRNGRGIPYKKAHQKALDDEELEAFARASMERRKLPSIIDDDGDLTVLEIAARTRRISAQLARQGGRLRLVVVDHIGKVRPAKTYRGRRDLEVGEITDRLAKLAKAEDLTVLALHQINRGPEDRANKRPQMPDLRDSGRVEEDADGIMLVYREAYYLARDKYNNGSTDEALRQKQLAEKQHIVEINVAKNRHGEIGTVELFCDMGCNVITDLDWRRK
jgi:replicative DNA helicase